MNTQAIASIPEATELALASLTPKMQAFVADARSTGNYAEAYRRNYSCEGWSNQAVAHEASLLAAHPKIAPILGSLAARAVSIAQQKAANALERLDTLGEIPEEATASRLAVSERANARLLEAAGVLKTGTAVNVQINNSNVDAGASGAWNEVGPDGLTGAERFRASQARVVEPEAGT